MTYLSAQPAKLFGREVELRDLAGRIVAARGGAGGALLVRGAPGIGKTSLLEAARAQASADGFQVLSATGVQSETHLPFAGLHQLLGPVLHDIDLLPVSYAKALQGAFGLIDEPVAGHHLVAMSMLQLLGESADRAPLLLLVDDAQWLDSSSAGALAFLARRLESDPIVLLTALRDGFESPFLEAGIPNLAIGALTDAQSEALLDARSLSPDPVLRDRVLRNAAGNPLALVELSTAIRSTIDAERVLLRSELPLTARLERAFADRLSGLAAETRCFLRVAAADDRGLLSELLAAASKLADRQLTLKVATEAKAASFVEINGSEVRFCHPLMRSAILETMNIEERQQAHAALAATLVGDPDRSAWHRAAAVVGTSDEIAAELDVIARRAIRRGAVGVAVEAIFRALRFVDQPEKRAALLVRAATLAWSAGRPGEVHRLLDLIDDESVPAWHRSDLASLREAHGRGTWPEASKIVDFIEAADQLRAQGDVYNGLKVLFRIAQRLHWSNPDDEPCKALVSTLGRFSVPEDEPAYIATLGLASPVEHGATVLQWLSDEPKPRKDYETPAFYLAQAAFAVGDLVRADRFLEELIQSFRARGALGALPGNLVIQTWMKIHRGDWRAADSMAIEATHLAEEMGQKVWTAVANLASATIAAYRGLTDRAEALAIAGEMLLSPTGANPVLATLQWPRGAAALATGRYDAAFHYLRRIFDFSDHAFNYSIRNWVLVDLVEAGVHSGHEREMEPIVGELERIGAKSHSPQLEGALRYARAALSPDGNEEVFRADDELAAWPFTRARLQLTYGIWLRRQRRPADARTPLRAARDAFDALGAVPWGERARQELRASGETSRRRTYELIDALSPQELQIAQLAAQGLSNKEIGQQLFVSHRTISTHLYRIFPKLGITARAQLRDALKGLSSQPSS